MDKSRRYFVLSAAALVAASGTAPAQSRKTWRIALLASLTPGDSVPYVKAIRDGLRSFGYVEGDNISLDVRAAGGVVSLPTLAADFVARNVDLIIAGGTPAARAAKGATNSIPIVFWGPSDPVGSGLVSSLARPGGNVTGLTDQGVDLAGKRLELLKQVVPRLERVAALGSPADPVWQPVWNELQPAARHLGVDLIPVLMTTPDQLEAIFSGLGGTAQALYVAPQSVFWQHREQIARLAASAKLPSIAEAREFVLSGGFMSYGTDYVALARDVAPYVDKILRGAFPGDLPVQQPTKFYLAISLRTAKALRLAIPESLRLLANELVQ